MFDPSVSKGLHLAIVFNSNVTPNQASIIYWIEFKIF